MPIRYPPLQLEQIKSIVAEGNIRRLSTLETHKRLVDAGINISVSTVKNYRTDLKASAQQWVGKLAKSKRYEYIAQYRERIQEVETIQKQLWRIISTQGTGGRTQVEACGRLLECTKQLAGLYDSLPLVNAIRDYDTIQEHRGPSEAGPTDTEAGDSPT